VPTADRQRRPHLRKSLGQHHLREGSVCRPMIEFLRLDPAATVLEIGAGGGVLTRELLAVGPRVIAVELDPAWAFRLARELAVVPIPAVGSASREPPRVAAVVADALGLDWASLPAGWRVAGNLPYNVGTAVVERFCRAARAGTLAGFLLQREVVDRMVAGPGDEAYGPLSVLVAIRARAVRLGRVKPGAFVPPPDVESAFVGLETREPPLPIGELAAFEAVVRAGFGQRRKSLRNALGAAWGRAEAERRLRIAGIDPGRRAETLSFDDFLAIHRAG
jgi:16S rRNA (adenine1518-N6/adenine1519-N6)-dimethyltransferase